MYTVREAAELLNISRTLVYYYMHKLELGAYDYSKKWVLSEEEITLIDQVRS